MSAKKTVAGKTLDQLAEENVKLKEKLRELMGVAKKQDDQTDADNAEMLDEGFGIFKQDGEYKLAELRYNRVSGRGMVVNIKNASRLPKDASMAFYETQQLLSQLMAKAEKEK